MRKLDRLGWVEGIALESFGVHVGLRVDTPETLPNLLKFLPPRWRKSRRTLVQRLYSLAVAGNCERRGVRRMNVLYGDFFRVARDAVLSRVLEAFEADLELYIATSAPHMTFLHAGVVGWQGRAIVVPGRSFSGKTTLVRELLRLGATYYSDEFAVLDDLGHVHPFARPLGIREGNNDSQTRYSADELGARSGAKPLPASLIVVADYQPGARWRPTPLSHGQGALELLANSVAVRKCPQQTLNRLHRFVASAIVVKGGRGEAHEAAASILDLANKQ